MRLPVVLRFCEELPEEVFDLETESEPNMATRVELISPPFALDKIEILALSARVYSAFTAGEGTVIFDIGGDDVGSVALGLIVGEAFPALRDSVLILLLGFVAYGLSIYFYVYAQRDLGAAKTSAYYAVAPFIGVLLSLIIFRELPGTLFFIALTIMILGTWLINHGQAENGGSHNEV